MNNPQPDIESYPQLPLLPEAILSLSKEALLELKQSMPYKTNRSKLKQYKMANEVSRACSSINP